MIMIMIIIIITIIIITVIMSCSKLFTKMEYLQFLISQVSFQLCVFLGNFPKTIVSFLKLVSKKN